MQICPNARKAEELSYGHFYLLWLYRLAEFFKETIVLPGPYLEYLYHSYLLHHKSGRYIEAAFTLLEHAKMLTWSRNETLGSEHRIVNRYFQFGNNADTNGVLNNSGSTIGSTTD